MSKETEMKMQLLDQLKEMLLGESGKRIPGKGVTVIDIKPISQDEVEDMDETMEGSEMEDEMEDEMLEELAAKELSEEDDDEENPKRKKSLREFLESLPD